MFVDGVRTSRIDFKQSSGCRGPLVQQADMKLATPPLACVA